MMYSGDETYGDEITSPLYRPQPAPVAPRRTVELVTGGRSYTVRAIEGAAGMCAALATYELTEDGRRAAERHVARLERRGFVRTA